MNCLNCKEEIGPDDEIDIMPVGSNPRPIHRNCLLRLTIGSVAHIKRRCSCFVPGSEEGDPPGMTLREAADAAARAFYESKETE